VRKHGIAIEHLVEVTHPEEEDAVWVRLFEARELTHRGGREMWVPRGVGPRDIASL
jgi:hypothetical protein